MPTSKNENSGATKVAVPRNETLTDGPSAAMRSVQFMIVAVIGFLAGFAVAMHGGGEAMEQLVAVHAKTPPDSPATPPSVPGSLPTSSSAPIPSLPPRLSAQPVSGKVIDEYLRRKGFTFDDIDHRNGVVEWTHEAQARKFLGRFPTEHAPVLERNIVRLILIEADQLQWSADQFAIHGDVIFVHVLGEWLPLIEGSSGD